jgi:hypothetical protein
LGAFSVILGVVASPCVAATGIGRSTGVPTGGAPGSSSHAKMLSAESATGGRTDGDGRRDLRPGPRFAPGLGLDFDGGFDVDFGFGDRFRLTDFVPVGLRFVVLAT